MRVWQCVPTMPRSESTWSAKVRKHMVHKPCPAAQGAQTLPESTWSRSHGLKNSMTFYDWKQKKTFKFNFALKMCVNWLILQMLDILLWILQKVQLVWSGIIGSSAILDFRIWNFLSSIFVYKLVLPVSHIGFYISFFFPYFKLKWNWPMQFESDSIGLCLVHSTLNIFP